MINSERYLRQAYSVEDLLKRRYLAFSRQAEKEGYPGIAKLFRATAQGGQVDLMAFSPGDRES